MLIINIPLLLSLYTWDVLSSVLCSRSEISHIKSNYPSPWSSTSWKTNNSFGSQEVPRILWKPKVHYRVCRSTTLVPTWSQIQSTPSHTLTLTSILILPSHLRLGLPSGLFLSSFPSKEPYVFLFSPHLPHALPISFNMILLPEQYLLRSKNKKLKIGNCLQFIYEFYIHGSVHRESNLINVQHARLIQFITFL